MHIKIRISVHPKDMDNLQYVIMEKINTLHGRHIKNIGGVVIPISLIDVIDNGTINQSGNTIFDILIDCDIKKLRVGDVVSSRIKEISVNGFYVEDDIEIFVNSITKKNIGDNVSVKIKSVFFSNGKFISIAEEV